MRTAEGPFPDRDDLPMVEGRRAIDSHNTSNHGQPAGFAKVTSPFEATAMRRATRNDLKRLKSLLEHQ
jgi:hypothetical protein